jgi:hypothetical protein
MEDFKTIKALIRKNEYFHRKGLIKEIEYAENCLIFAEKIDVILNEKDRLMIKSFLTDEFSLPKFKLSVEIIKAIPN